MAAVLIVSPWYLPLLGGQERQVALLAAEYRRMGYAVDVLTERADAASPAAETSPEGIRVTRVGRPGRRGPLAYLRVGAGLVRFVVRRRRRYRFVIVRTLTFPALVVGVLKALRILRAPTLVTAETGGEADDVIALRGYPGFRLLRAVLRRHDRLNAICAANLEHYRALGFAEERLTHVLNGVDTSPYAAARFPERVETFGFLGRLHPEKGLFELLDAIEELPAARLLIAGEGEAGAELRAIVAERGLGDRVELLGRVPYEELGAFFDRIDCLVLPSYSEGLPLSVLEAAAHRRAIVATDVGDLRALFGESLFLARMRDAEDLRAAMARAMAPGATSALSYDAVIDRVAIGAVARAIERLLTAPAA